MTVIWSFATVVFYPGITLINEQVFNHPWPGEAKLTNNIDNLLPHGFKISQKSLFFYS